MLVNRFMQWFMPAVILYGTYYFSAATYAAVNPESAFFNAFFQLCIWGVGSIAAFAWCVITGAEVEIKEDKLNSTKTNLSEKTKMNTMKTESTSRSYGVHPTISRANNFWYSHRTETSDEFRENLKLRIAGQLVQETDKNDNPVYGDVIPEDKRALYIKVAYLGYQSYNAIINQKKADAEKALKEAEKLIAEVAA